MFPFSDEQITFNRINPVLFFKRTNHIQSGFYVQTIDPVVFNPVLFSVEQITNQSHFIFQTNKSQINPVLFSDDAIESNDLSSTYPDVVTLLKEKLDEYRKLEAVPFNPKTLRGALPKFWNGVWSPGWC